jgi:ABC-type lipoprotein export system ATPase subunit
MNWDWLVKEMNDRKEVDNITILGGVFKNGEPENIELTIHKGEIISIVGPTGSGKSRLLCDIEWMAQKDTPTKRQILVNGQTPDYELRIAVEEKLVSQLSQNMNFIMDIQVLEFLQMHAESLGISKDSMLIQTIIKETNLLAGEPFQSETPLTSLSGGQSRALMIADIAYLSKSPIVLIDEIENAGIDRSKALDLLVKKEKIILMVTHDPILSLMADRRIIIKHGGIYRVLYTSPEEKSNLEHLERMDMEMMIIRNRLRMGERIL